MPSNDLGGPAFLKWAGGKRQLLRQLMGKLPLRFQEYYEPMCGGAALFFALKKQAFARPTHLFDINKDLIDTYIAVRDQVGDVIRVLQTRYTKNEEAFYYSVRGEDPSLLMPEERAARFIYLNKVCFNGLYRVNKNGEFNVPFGKYVNPTICNVPRLQASSQALQNVDIRHAHYGVILEAAQPYDFVYFDPPYHPVSETANFTAFTEEGFDTSAQVMLAAVAKQLRDKGVYVMLSNSDTAFTRELYQDFYVDLVQAPRTINRVAERRGPVPELLVRSYPS